MTDLLKTPFSHAGDLGKPMPGWPHATSVCMPKWADNIDYEKGDSRVTNGLACGYPRFIFHPYIKNLFAECERRFAQNGERCMALPSRAAAETCQGFLYGKESYQSGRISVETGIEQKKLFGDEE